MPKLDRVFRLEQEIEDLKILEEKRKAEVGKLIEKLERFRTNRTEGNEEKNE